MRRATFLLIAAALLLAGGCATTRLTSEWRATDYAGPAFRKLVVVGFTGDVILRRVFEDQFAVEFAQRGVAVTASYTLAPKTGEPDREALERIVAEAGADAVLTIRLVHAYQQTYVYPWPYGYPGPYYGFYGYYPYAYRGAWMGYAYAPLQVATYNVVVLETQLFQGANPSSPVWGALSRTFASGDPRGDAVELSRLVADALAAAHLIEVRPGTP